MRAGAAESSAAARARTLLAEGDEILVTGAFGPAVSSFADAFAAASGGVVLDLELLEENSRGALDGQTVGYAYAIARDGILHAEPETRALMDSGFLGWLDPDAYAAWMEGTWGTYRAHQGRYNNMVGCIMNFPSAANRELPGVKVQVSLLINSEGGTLGGDLPVEGPRHVCKVLEVAYDEAWVAN